MDEFTEEQKQYLSGFVSGANLARQMSCGLPTFASTLAALGLAAPGSQLPAPGAESREPGAASGASDASPDALWLRAQERTLAEGSSTLVPEELAKRKRHPLDRWEELCAHAREERYPRGTDVFAFKYHGLFYVAPAQDAYMCRLRFPGGIVSSFQMRRVAEVAESWGGGYAHVTTRANLQVREIRARDAVAVLTALQEAGIVTRGAGADNIRNVTGSPTAGIDPQELIDVRPLCRELHHYILNHRDLYGLPRKFNVAFDGGGSVSVLEDTNDIGFAAVRVTAERGSYFANPPPGVYFRMQLGGITGHGDFARDTGWLLRPEECVPVAAAVARVFIEHGDRTDRKKARLKYLLDRWGHERFLDAVRARLSFTPVAFPLADCFSPRLPTRPDAHLGVHPQRQPGLYYLGILLPVGRLEAAQMRGLAEIADRFGSGTLRLTVWQNLLLSDVPEAKLPEARAAIEALGLDWRPSPIRAGLVACTGNGGCRFAASDTKGHALALAAHLEAHVPLDRPVNLHLTGCPHSCAQHSIGDIGFLGTRVARGEEDVKEGYHVYIGGGFGSEAGIGREIYRDIPATELPRVTERMLAAYLRHRRGPEESFLAFARRHDTEALRALFDEETRCVRKAACCGTANGSSHAGRLADTLHSTQLFSRSTGAKQP